MTTFFFFYQLKCIFRSTSNWRQRQRQQTTELHKNLIDSAAHMNTMIFLYPHPPRRPCAIFIKSVCVCTLSLYPSEHSTVSEIFLLFFFSLFVAVYFIYLNFIDVLVGSLLATRLVAATATATSQKYARPIKWSAWLIQQPSESQSLDRYSVHNRWFLPIEGWETNWFSFFSYKYTMNGSCPRLSQSGKRTRLKMNESDEEMANHTNRNRETRDKYAKNSLMSFLDIECN